MAAAAAACSEPGLVRVDEPPKSVDAGPPPQAISLAPPELPRSAELPRWSPGPTDDPVLTPCPPGWREVETSSTTICDPWPEDGARACGRGEAHFPGTEGCAPVGAPCPDGVWPEGLPTDATILYVRSSTSSGYADGTRAAPYHALYDAVRAAPRDAIIALAKGTFEGGVRIGGLTLWGACARDTIISTNTTGPLIATVVATDYNAKLTNLTVTGPRAGIYGLAEVVVSLGGVVIEDARGLGAGTFGGSLSGDDVVIRRIATRDGDPSVGLGVEVLSGAGKFFNLVIEDVAHTAFRARESNVQLEDVSVRRVAIDPQGRSDGAGFILTDTVGSVLRVVVEDAGTVGLAIDGDGSFLTAEDVVIRRIGGDGAGDFGWGLANNGSNSLVVQRAFIAGTRSAAIFGYSASRTTLTDAVINDVEPELSSGFGGAGVEAQNEAQLEVARVIVERAYAAGLQAWDPRTVIRASHVQLRDTVDGFGVFASEGARIQLDHADIARCRSEGARAHGAGSELVLADVVLRDNDGCGLSVEHGAARVKNVLIAGNRPCGVVQESGLLTMEDVEVAESRPAPDGTFGQGLHLYARAVATMDRVLIRDNLDVGLTMIDEGTRVTARDLTIRDTKPAPEVVLSGLGLELWYGASATVTRALLERNYGMGMSVFEDASLRAEDVTVRDTRQIIDQLGIGVALQHGTLSASRLLVERNFDAAIRAVPGTVHLEDVTLQDTASRLLDGHGGVGLDVSRGAIVTGRAIAIERSHDAGIRASAPGTSLDLTDILVRDTFERECAATTCTGRGIGHGVVALSSAAVSLHHFLVTRNALTGFQLFAGGELDLEDGEISHTKIGVNIEVPGFDPNRLIRIFFHDNRVDKDWTSLPEIPPPDVLPPVR